MVQFLRRGILRHNIGNTATGSHNKNTVRDIKYLVDIVADNKEGMVLLPQAAQQLHGLVGFPDAHSGGGFIQ